MTDDRKPYISVLSYSGGAQSHALLEMVLRGELEKPRNFLVMNADPGMEDSRTYRFVQDARERCIASGINFITAPGPNLYHDLLNTVSNGATRVDNPPYWTKSADGKLGRLMQKCTRQFKIAPMDRALRRYMEQKHSISAGLLRPGLVEKWIGFAADEWHRCSDSPQQYIRFRFPLIERKMDRPAIDRWYDESGIPKPPRSVCSACFANGLDYFREMYANRPDDWRKAVAVDDSISIWKAAGITDHEPFVSSSLIRLRDLPAIGFGVDSEDLSEHHCNSGACFL
jgi:hypothetical protein